MFQTYIEQPIFNLLVIIYSAIPGHDLGIAIILFTVVIRVLMWPLVRKQLHHTKAMRELAPELKKIKASAKGDRQKEARLQMELYKENGVKPFSTIGTLIIQIPIFIALYRSVLKLINDPSVVQSFSYPWVHNLPWVRELAQTPEKFSAHFLGVFDLLRSGFSATGIYWAAIFLALVAAITQFVQSKSLMPDTKDARKLTEILKDAGSGKQADQAEINASISKSMIYFLPAITFFFASSLASALSLYFFTSSGVGYLQQLRVFKEDEQDLKEITEEVKDEKPKPKKKKKPSKAKKRRRK